MAERPNVKDILAKVRQGGPAKAEDAKAAPAEPEPVQEELAAPAEAEAAPAAPVAAAPTPNVPTAASLGRPLSLKEKLAAARAGGAAPPAAAAPKAPAVAAPAPAPVAEPEPAVAEAAPASPAEPLGRPMTLKEKLAAARGAASAPAAGARPAAAAPAKPAAAPKAAAAGAARVLPPLEKITDPKDLAEAARQAGASKVKAAAAKAEEGKPVKAGHKKAETPVVPPKPKKEAVLAATTASAAAGQSRRAFLGRVSVGAWVIAGWATFTAGMVALTAACGRFMFPNVLAEPPSTIKVGLPSNFEPEEVSERYKTEWGFWIVRSTKYNGADIIYALQSVCTHLGCPPNWLAAEQKFKCPCHGSGFYVSGVNFEGPAPRPLERFKIVLADDGQLMIDKTQKFQEEMGQWTDPDSFVLV